MKYILRRRFFIVAVIILLILVSRYVYYGSFFSTCIYSVNELKLPAELTNQQLKTIKPSLRISNDRTYVCADSSLASGYEITQQQLHIDLRPDIVTSDIPANSTFTILGVKEILTHGISTLDTNPSPIYVIVLESPDGRIYRITTTMLNSGGAGHLMTHVNSEGKEIPIDANFFSTTIGQKFDYDRK